MHDTTRPAHDAQLRSGTAARLAGVPVTTLRVWERRYGVVEAPKTPTGQRLYSAHDVQRLRLLKQLTLRGHAIGTVAALPLEMLRALLAGVPDAPAAAAPSASRRIVVVGTHAAQKLRAIDGPESLVVHADLDEAERADESAPACQVLLVHQPSLQRAAAARVLALASRRAAEAVVVLYAFGAEADAEFLRNAGATVRREPISGRELARLVSAAPRASARLSEMPPVAERRYTDAVLVDLIERPSNVACECLRHVAEIALQLSGFERYSAECVSSSPADATLHRQLNATAGAARTLFETALAGMLDDAGQRR